MSDKMVCQCGNDKFYAVQRVVSYETVIVDSNGDYNDYVDSSEFVHPDADPCVDCDEPEGPFFCTECGKEFC